MREDGRRPPPCLPQPPPKGSVTSSGQSPVPSASSALAYAPEALRLNDFRSLCRLKSVPVRSLDLPTWRALQRLNAH